MPTTAELLRANLHEVFGRDASVRRRAIEAAFAPDAVFTDPEHTTTGWDGIEQTAEALLGAAPDDFVFVEDGLVYESAEAGALPWAFGPPGAPVVHGIDIITVRGGRIASLVTLVHP
ncbi:nuclear transport factor 2 family protein [Subtercola sp. YIM 133946]|uniref:nuclear transport factor 2 family protein n=1 Tax=Subtercola sp. YIM 133946 TaxID=3118909 RepID=UPI002F953329